MLYQVYVFDDHEEMKNEKRCQIPWDIGVYRYIYMIWFQIGNIHFIGKFRRVFI